jgi:hypothetical protein
MRAAPVDPMERLWLDYQKAYDKGSTFAWEDAAAKPIPVP